MRKSNLFLWVLMAGFILQSCSKEENPDDQLQDENVAFVKSQQTLGNIRTFGLDMADIDKDGDLDVCTGNYLGNTLLWTNNGQATFLRSDQTFNSQEVHDAEFVDFNNDTYPDIMLVGHNAAGKIYFNNQDGSFTSGQQNIGQGSNNPQHIYHADIDLDGDQDVLIYNFVEKPNRVWVNDGTGLLTERDIDYGGSAAKDFALVDFDGDQYPDLFILMRQSNNELWLNDGAGNFEKSASEVGVGGDHVDYMDYDNDGDLDLIIGGGEGIVAWINSGSGTFNEVLLVDEAVLDFVLFDADNDQDIDAVTIHPEQGNKFFLNNGAGSFSSLGKLFGDERTLTVECADLDNDGDVDVVLGQLEGTGGNSIYFNNSK